MTQTLESLSFYQFACACFHATMTTTICPKDYAGFEHSKETVECEGNKSECELKIKIVAMEKSKRRPDGSTCRTSSGNRTSSSHTTNGKKVIIKAGKKSATTIIKIYPKQMVLKKQNVTLSCTPQWKEGGISKLTILLKRK